MTEEFEGFELIARHAKLLGNEIMLSKKRIIFGNDFIKVLGNSILIFFNKNEKTKSKKEH